MQSTIAEVVMDDSMHKIAVMASSRVTSFLNISLAWAVTFKESKHRIRGIRSPEKFHRVLVIYLVLGVSNFPTCGQLF